MPRPYRYDEHADGLVTRFAYVTDRISGERKPGTEGLRFLYGALGGPANVGRLFCRHRITAARWLRGSEPMPGWVARELQRQAQYVASRLAEIASVDLRQAIDEGEARKARGLRARREAFFRRFGEWPRERRPEDKKRPRR
jgi:hypothetical protein